MPLNAVNFVPNTGQIKAVDLKNFYDLFTGAMTDQPVTFANTLTVGGSHGFASTILRINGVALQSGNYLEARALASDVQPVFLIFAGAGSGTVGIGIGPGGSVGADILLGRTAANRATFTGRLTVTPSGGDSAIVATSGGIQIAAGGLQVTAGGVALHGPLANGTVLTAVGTVAVPSVIETGVWSNLTGSTTATTTVEAFGAKPISSTSAYTVVNAIGFHAYSPVRGVGSTVTNAYQFYADAITAVVNNAYGMWINAPTGGTGTNHSLNVQGTSGADFIVVATGSVFLGASARGAVLATTAITEFPFIPACAGVPTGAPTSAGASAVPMVYDTTNNKIMFYNGSWRGVVVA